MEVFQAAVKSELNAKRGCRFFGAPFSAWLGPDVSYATGPVEVLFYSGTVNVSVASSHTMASAPGASWTGPNMS